MRYCASDKTQIIRLVEQSPWPARRTLEKLGVSRSILYVVISAADQKPSRIAPHGRTGSGTASQRLSAARLSTWRWISRNSARGNWRCASPTSQNILSRRPRSIGF